MNSSHKISVIVPVYNKKEYLGQCIDSIISQTYQNMEILLVDDGSTDGSGEICDTYVGKDDRIRVIHQENSGPTTAVLAGLQKASGSYCTFIDSDDYVRPEMLKEMASHLTGQAGEIVCCNHILEKSKETVSVIQALKPGVYESDRLDREIKDRLLGEETKIIPMSRCMKLCEKSVFEGNEKYYDPKIRMGEDFNLMYPALLNSTRIVILEGALFYHYRYVESSLAHAYNPNLDDSIERWYQAALKVIHDKNVADGEVKLRKEYCYMMMYVMKNGLRNPERDYIQKIREIFLRPEVRERIIGTHLSVKNRANMLLYWGMRHPNKAVLRILRGIMQNFDRKERQEDIHG